MLPWRSTWSSLVLSSAVAAAASLLNTSTLMAQQAPAPAPAPAVNTQLNNSNRANVGDARIFASSQPSATIHPGASVRAPLARYPPHLFNCPQAAKTSRPRDWRMKQGRARRTIS